VFQTTHVSKVNMRCFSTVSIQPQNGMDVNEGTMSSKDTSYGAKMFLKKLQRLVLMGVPGAGKGTFARLMKDDLDNVDTIVAGDLIRDNIKQKTPEGLIIKDLVDKGSLVPDDIVSALVMPKLNELNGRYCLDGFPRTIDQCNRLHNSSVRPELVLDVRIPDEVLVLKTTNRWNCTNCGQGYNTADIKGEYNGVMLNMPPLLPEKHGICDKCGGELKQRTDDTEETVRARLKVYTEETEPLIDFYEKEGLLVQWDVVNGVQDYPQLAKKIDDHLSRLYNSVTR